MPGEGVSLAGPEAAEGEGQGGPEQPGVAAVHDRTGDFVLRPDLTSGIPWRHRLSTRLLVLTAILTLVGVVVFAVTEARFQDTLMEQVEAGAELFSHTIERATHRAMLEDRRQDAYEIMRVIAAEPGTEKVRIFNKEGRITFSTDAGDINTLVDKKAEACFACHRKRSLERPLQLCIVMDVREDRHQCVWRDQVVPRQTRTVGEEHVGGADAPALDELRHHLAAAFERRVAGSRAHRLHQRLGILVLAELHQRVRENRERRRAVDDEGCGILQA